MMTTDTAHVRDRVKQFEEAPDYERKRTDVGRQRAEAAESGAEAWKDRCGW